METEMGLTGKGLAETVPSQLADATKDESGDEAHDTTKDISQDMVQNEPEGSRQMSCV